MIRSQHNFFKGTKRLKSSNARRSRYYSDTREIVEKRISEIPGVDDSQFIKEIKA